MRKIDIILPHRLLINQALRKEGEKLKVHIEEYRRRYDEQYQDIIAEIEITRDKHKEEFEKVQNKIMTRLSLDVDATRAIKDTITSYVSTYFKRQLAYKLRKLNTIQKQIIEEYIGFLSEQMHEIGVEIDSLRARSDLLFREADVSDIVQLIQLSGCALDLGERPDAQELLDTVNGRLDMAVMADNNTEWCSLLNVRTILEERVSFLAEIRYISWVIEQKIQLSKELKTIRVKQEKIERTLLIEAESLQKEIAGISSVLCKKAKEVRLCFSRPLDSIEKEIEDNLSRVKKLRNTIADQSQKKKSLYEEKDEIQKDLDRMKEEHSSDTYRWERLRREKRDLTDEIKDVRSKMDSCFSEIDSLNLDISELKSQKATWINMRKSIFQVMQESNVPII